MTKQEREDPHMIVFRKQWVNETKRHQENKRESTTEIFCESSSDLSLPTRLVLTLNFQLPLNNDNKSFSLLSHWHHPEFYHLPIFGSKIGTKASIMYLYGNSKL